MLLELALAPAFICLFYIHIRDKYEKEPFYLLATGVLFGAVSTSVILGLVLVIKGFEPSEGSFLYVIYTAFLASAGIEESVKYLFLYCLVWKNKNFNEPFDGIVYSTFISLGYAMVENIIYVLNPKTGGVETAVSRAVFSVPGHAAMGVAMGFYFAYAKFEPENKNKYLKKAFIAPYLIHAFYNFFLLIESIVGMGLFLLLVVYMWRGGFKKMRILSEKSPFKN